MSKVTRYLLIFTLTSGSIAGLIAWGESFMQSPVGNDIKGMWSKADTDSHAQAEREAAQASARDARQALHDHLHPTPKK